MSSKGRSTRGKIQLQRPVQKSKNVVDQVTSQSGRGRGVGDEKLHFELEERVKTLQLPSACSFIFSMVERYVRSLSSHEIVSTSLPSRESLLLLIDKYILKIPSPKKQDAGAWPFTVFEELELLESLRVQIEERQSKDIQLALFDAVFGMTRDNEHSSKHRQKILQKLSSLSVSLGCTIILQCVACWMEFYPIEATQLAEVLYYEFCELLPKAMDPLINVSNICPSLARQMTNLLTASYHIYSVQDKTDVNHTHNLCPPIRLLQLVSHWVSANPEYFTSTTLLVDLRDDYVLLRSQKPRSCSPIPIPGLIQWCILEPLLPDRILSSTPSNEWEGEMLVNNVRLETSKLHADILVGLFALPTTPIRTFISTDEIVIMVANLLGLKQALGVEADDTNIDTAIERLAQILQAGLTVGAITLTPDGLASVAATIPSNRLLDMVMTRQRSRDH